MTIEDVVNFVEQHKGQSMPTIGGRAKFSVENTGDKAFTFWTEAKTPRNENHTWVGKSLQIFNQTGSFKMADYPHTRNASYVLGLFWQILVQQKQLQNLPVDLPIDEKEVNAAGPTEQIDLRRSRLGQGKYREDLIKLRSKCYVSGISSPDFIRASHIKPWSNSNNHERVDPHNGLLLIPNYDLLFDRGYISFADDGKILVSDELPQKIIAMFQVDVDFRGSDLGDRTKQYLDFHRKNNFRGEVPSAT